MTYDGRLRYYYDCENRLTEVNDVDDMPVASYKYDFAGRRVKKIDYTLSPVRYTLYLYDGDQIIGIYDGTSGYLLRKFYYGPRDLSAGWRIDEPICMHRTIFDVNGFGFYYYHYDGFCTWRESSRPAYDVPFGRLHNFSQSGWYSGY